jgi:uncharacterized protein (TIGR00299 family) protein
MRHLHFDCSSGIAGDMVLGAMIDAGGDFEGLERALRTLPLEGWRLERQAVERGGLAATQVRVIRAKREHAHRHLPMIEKFIADSNLTPRAKERAARAFRLLAEAEARVHRIPPEKVHFHEVGAIDAIVDICGAMHLITAAGVEAASASSVEVGSGTVECEHGVMPVPAPATVELLRGVPTHSEGPPGELATPTGCAILRAVASTFGRQPDMRVDVIGHGAGTKERPGRPNLLRVLIGEAEQTSLPVESRPLLVLSAEIDDMTPELLAPIIDRTLAAGARDAHLAPIQMKKGRAAHRLVVLAPPERRDALVELIFRETTTFGVKVESVERLCLARRFEEVETPWGAVRVKIGLWGDEVLRATPEFEDCRALAQANGVPLPTVFAAAQAAIHARWGKGAK